MKEEGDVRRHHVDLQQSQRPLSMMSYVNTGPIGPCALYRAPITRGPQGETVLLGGCGGRCTVDKIKGGPSLDTRKISLNSEHIGVDI